ncbi:serine hydrolase domain-containing protein [Spongiivirga citrea]|uniref:Serine hydrolase n=1 Tax=Spongiivirga citrea TaxID=1481457 RepID=A0A6M0CJ22_9FLAO|nr:serine hydrolase [Spongiivirga citrea]NER17552.1 serine hydrolase [Spongiivirga citrea]
MNNTLKFATIALFLCINTFEIVAQENHSILAKKIDAYLNKGVSNGFNGAVLIERNGEVILNKGYGKADKVKNISNTPNTIFDIGSNTKQFTGAAILKLAELHKLKVTDSLHTFFNNLPDDKKNITIHQLLTHTGGFQESLDGDFELISTQDFFRNVFNSKLFQEPGTKFNYSNLGYSILARIIEITSKMNYENFLQEFLFKPSGMNQTGYLLPEWNAENLANGYNRNILDQGTTIERYKEDGQVSWNLKGNGGINSTSNDLLLWKKAINSNKILPQELTEKWIQPYTLEINHYYGYGWGIYNTADKIIYHNGGNGAFTHTIIWNMAKDYFIIYSSNSSSPKIENVAYEIEQALTNDSYVPKEIEKNPYFFVMSFIEQHNINDSDKLLRLIIDKYSADFGTSEVLNRLGYITMRSENNSEWAIKLFKFNTRLFENEANVWDSLGDGHLAIGNKEEAIINFKKAINLGSEETLKKLKKLQQN